MARTTGTPSIPAALRRQLQITSAVAKERLVEVHLRYAVELVDHARSEVDPARAISIYARLHSLSDTEAKSLHHKVFVDLGRRGTRGGLHLTLNADPERETPRSVIGVIRRRIRGRVNADLREWVEYHTGRTETELLWTHVENALKFADVLEPVMGMGDAVTAYAEDVGLEPARASTVYYLALAHRSAKVLPRPRPVPENERPIRSLTDTTQHSLRIVRRPRGAGRLRQQR